MFRRFLFVCTLFVTVACLVAVVPAQAQNNNNCVAVRGIAQQHLLDFGSPDWEGGRPDDAWVGPVQLAVGEAESFIGKVSEFDGEPGPSHHTGQARNGSFYFDFGSDGSFIVRYPHMAAWPTLPKFVGTVFGTFRAEGEVDEASGTGRFVNVTGHFTFAGPYMAWNLDKELPSGRFNNTITGTLCNVAPK